MSSNVIATRTFPARSRERLHHFRIVSGYVLVGTILLALAVYGFNYYTLGPAARPLSPKHDLLKPSGTIGLKLGILGMLVFMGIFLYPIRKRWPWLSKKGSARHWLDVHVLLGISGPFIIAFHSSFKFRGMAGMAFWIMTAVALSGVIGRYLYAQIPRSLSAAEMSLKESQELQARLTQQLSGQELISAADLVPLFRLPSPERVRQLPVVVALGYMLALDCGRPFHVARLRLRTLSLGGGLLTLGGILRSRNSRLETVIKTARQQAALSKRILFLSRSQQVFHLWHVVHRPFSYSFAVLACIHIGAVLLLGYM
jgi:hypothetical protein